MQRRRQLLAEALRKGYDAGKPPSGTPQSIRRLLDAFFEGRWRHHAGKHDIDASLVHRLDIICAGADDGSYRHAVARSTPGNSDRSLSLGGLCIHAPFAGDDEIGLAEVLVEGERIEHGIDSRPDLRCAEGGKASAETACCPRTRKTGYVTAYCLADKLPIALECPVKHGEACGRKALLRPVDEDGAIRSGKRILHIGKRLERAGGKTRIYPGRVHLRKFFEPCNAGTYGLAGTVEEAHPEGLSHARSPVGRGTPSEADKDMPASLVERITDELACAVRGGPKRFIFCLMRERDAGSSRTFDEGRAVFEHGIGCLCHIPERTMHGPCTERPLSCRHQRCNRPFPAIGYRIGIDCGIRQKRPDAFCDRALDLLACGRALVGIGCKDEDMCAHGSLLESTGHYRSAQVLQSSLACLQEQDLCFLQEAQLMGTHRGYDPKDRRTFSPENVRRLRKAHEELGYLLDHGYPRDTAAAFVGNRYQFQERQRLALLRATAGKRAAAARQKKLRALSDCADEVLLIDGFNVLIPLEVALTGGPVILAEDGSVRDLAGLSGTWRPIPATEQALSLVAQALAAAPIAEAHILLDEPVSNSGKLAGLYEEALKNLPYPVSVTLDRTCDRTLGKARCAASNDSRVIDEALSWVSLDRDLLRFCPDAWLLDFS